MSDTTQACVLRRHQNMYFYCSFNISESGGGVGGETPNHLLVSYQ
jgi:hypothetical protein